MSIKATLGGVPLTISNGVTWGLTYGVTPYQRTFVTSRARALKILEQRGPITLDVLADGYPRLKVDNLYALHLAPAGENNLGVVVVDSRWLWSRQSLTRDYNVRRRSGDFRRVGNFLQAIQAKAIIGDFTFRRATLKEGRRWTAREVLDDVLTEMVGVGNFDIGATQFSVDIEGLVLDKDRGDAALARVLSYLPGARVYQGLDGKIHVVSALDGSEAQAVKDAGPRYRHIAGQIELVDRSKIRPQNVNVQYEPEPELRFNYDEDAPNPSMIPNREPLILQNVFPVTDPSITYTQANGERITVEQGTWLTVDEWILAVNSLDDAPIANVKGDKAIKMPSVSRAQMREHYLNGYQVMRMKYVGAQLGYVNVLWEKRIAAIQANFRRTFRILPRWMDKLRSIRAVRASILDQETGTRGKAEAFFNYLMIPSRRTLAKGSHHDQAIGFNVTGYADDLTGAQSSPAVVNIIDEDSGIFSLEFRTDPWGDSSRLAPGTVPHDRLVAGLAAADPALFASLDMALDTGWKLAVVLTVATAVPNNSTRPYEVKVSLADALAMIPGAVKSTKAEAPDWYIGISAGVETARFMWTDDPAGADEIRNSIFGVQRWTDKWLTNKATTEAISKATAARVQSLLLDRYEGAQAVALNPGIVPTGSMSMVSHGILGNGAAVTYMNLPPLLHAPDIYSMLPDGARKILQRQVQP